MHTFFVFLSILVVVILLVAILLIFLGKGKKAVTPLDEEDELLVDPVTGKKLSVEELLDIYRVEMVSDELTLEVHRNLTENDQNLLSVSDTYNILDAHFQLKGAADDDHPYDQEELALLLIEKFRLRGKEITPELIAAVVRLSENRQEP